MFYTLAWYDTVCLYLLDMFCIQWLYSYCMDPFEYNKYKQKYRYRHEGYSSVICCCETFWKFLALMSCTML